MTCIDEHTFDEKLLTGGWVLDIGCRWWHFSTGLKSMGEQVLALDIEDFKDVPEDIRFINAALWINNDPIEAHFFGNGSANFLKGLNGIPYNGPDRPCETRYVKSVTLENLYTHIGENIDLLKLDCEAAEYFILDGMRPVPRQLSIEYHEHCAPDRHHELFDKVHSHLLKFYEATFHSKYDRYKYMDTLYIRK